MEQLDREQREERHQRELEALAEVERRRAREVAHLEEIRDPIERFLAIIVWLTNNRARAPFWPAKPWEFPDHVKLQEHSARTLNRSLEVFIDELEKFHQRPSRDLEDDKRALEATLEAVPIRVGSEANDLVEYAGKGWPWDSEQIGRWFATRVTWDFAPNVRFARGLIAESRRAYILTSTAYFSGQDYTHLCVLEDGRVVSVERMHPKGIRFAFSIYRLPGIEKKAAKSPWRVAELPPVALAQMASILELKVPGYSIEP